MVTVGDGSGGGGRGRHGANTARWIKPLSSQNAGAIRLFLFAGLWPSMSQAIFCTRGYFQLGVCALLSPRRDL